MKLTVHVKLVSPTMIGGAEAKKLDDLNWLRPSSIRGMLHFWFRAVTPHADMADLLEKEKAFLGGTKEGSTFKILPPLVNNPSRIKLKLFPNKEGAKMVPTTMLFNGDETIQIQIMAHALESAHLQFLYGLLWLWLHLGAIGRRSRRGYGSLLWAPNVRDDLSRFFLPIDTEKCDSPATLEKQLKSSLNTAASLLGINLSLGNRAQNNYFRLTTIDQIFVGKLLTNKLGASAEFANIKGEMQHLIHGMDENARLISSPGSVTPGNNEKKEMGYAHGENRLASPMLWRLYPCQGGFVPVMTWSPRYHAKLTPGTKMHDYLTNTLGFKNSLTGSPL